MKSLFMTISSVILGLLIECGAAGAPVVVAGSHLVSSPPFIASSFWGATARIERAFPFEVVDGGPWKVDELRVAVYRFTSIGSATSAQFTLNSDDGGVPGANVATFALNNIPTTPQIVSLLPLEQIDVVLYPDTPYWIVAGPAQGQLNWNMSDNEFGTTASRVDGEDWVVEQQRNLSAYAILATPVPEPAGLVLWIVAMIGLPGRTRFARQYDRRRGLIHSSASTHQSISASSWPP